MFSRIVGFTQSPLLERRGSRKPRSAAAPEVPQAAPMSPQRQAALDAMLDGVPTPCKRRITSILSPLPTGLLGDLGSHGLRLEISAPDIEAPSGDVKVMGVYDPTSRRINFERDTLFSGEGPHTVLHEVWHAVDHMEGERQQRFQIAPYASETDVRLRGVYNQYAARCNVENIDGVRATVRKNFGEARRAHFDLEDAWGVRTVDFQKQNGREIYRLRNESEVPPTVRRAVQSLTMLGCGVSGAAMGAILSPMAPMVGAAVGGALALGGAWLMSKVYARIAQKKEEAQTTTIQVPLPNGQQATVKQSPHTALVDMPADGRVPDSHEWSTYAWRAGDVREYVAEGVSHYLAGGISRMVLQAADPEMYRYVEQKVNEEFQQYK